jgi:hypothetical protein
MSYTRPLYSPVVTCKSFFDETPRKSKSNWKTRTDPGRRVRGRDHERDGTNASGIIQPFTLYERRITSPSVGCLCSEHNAWRGEPKDCDEVHGCISCSPATQSPTPAASCQQNARITGRALSQTLKEKINASGKNQRVLRIWREEVVAKEDEGRAPSLPPGTAEIRNLQQQVLRLTELHAARQGPLRQPSSLRRRVLLRSLV